MDRSSIIGLLRRALPSIVLIGLVVFILFPVIYEELSCAHNHLGSGSSSDEVGGQIIVVTVSPLTAAARTTIVTVRPLTITANESREPIQANPRAAWYDLYMASTHMFSTTALANTNTTLTQQLD